MRLVEELGSISQAVSLSKCPRSYHFKTLGRSLSSRQKETRIRTGLLLPCTGCHSLQQRAREDFLFVQAASLKRKGQ